MRCAQHGDQLVQEPGGVDMPTIHGRRYCPSCQAALMALLDEVDRGSAVTESRKRGIIHRLYWDCGLRRLIRRFW